MLVRSGIILLKYWFSVSDAEQESRFQDRAHDPLKRWKLSPMDLKSREKWVEFSKAKDEMFSVDGHPRGAVVSRSSPTTSAAARLNCISHILDTDRPTRTRCPGRSSCRRGPPQDETTSARRRSQHMVHRRALLAAGREAGLRARSEYMSGREGTSGGSR